MDALTGEDHRRGEWDFSVDFDGHCFLCLIKLEEEPNGATSAWTSFDSSSNFSIHCLSRYLKLDLRKEYYATSVPIPRALEQGDIYGLGVPLCPECCLVNDAFSKLHGQLEEIKLKMANCLKDIQHKLRPTAKGTSGSNGKFERSTKLVSVIGDLLSSKEGLTFGMALRRQFDELCFRKVPHKLYLGGSRLIAKEMVPSQSTYPFTEYSNANYSFEDSLPQVNADDDNNDSLSEVSEDDFPSYGDGGDATVMDDASTSNIVNFTRPSGGQDTSPPQPEYDNRIADQPSEWKICRKCYAEDHSDFDDCPFKAVDSRTPEFYSTRTARLLKIRQVFGLNNPIDRQMYKESKARRERKKFKTQLYKLSQSIRNSQQFQELPVLPTSALLDCNLHNGPEMTPSSSANSQSVHQPHCWTPNAPQSPVRNVPSPLSEVSDDGFPSEPEEGEVDGDDEDSTAMQDTNPTVDNFIHPGGGQGILTPGPQNDKRITHQPTGWERLCSLCYDENHMHTNCPFRTAASRTPEIAAMIAAKKVLLIEKFGEVNPVEKNTRKRTGESHITKEVKRLCQRFGVPQSINSSSQCHDLHAPPTSALLDCDNGQETTASSNSDYQPQTPNVSQSVINNIDSGVSNFDSLSKADCGDSTVMEDDTATTINDRIDNFAHPGGVQDISTPNPQDSRIPDEQNDSTFCFGCYDENHRQSNCPYRSAASKTPEIRAVIAKRLRKLREKFGRDNPVDERKRKFREKKRQRDYEARQMRRELQSGQGLSVPSSSTLGIPHEPPTKTSNIKCEPLDLDSGNDMDSGEVSQEKDATVMKVASATTINGNRDNSTHHCGGQDISTPNPDDFHILDEQGDSTLCFNCYDESHTLVTCPYRSADSKTPEIRTAMAERLRKLRERFGGDNPIDRRKRKAREKKCQRDYEARQMRRELQSGRELSVPSSSAQETPQEPPTQTSNIKCEPPEQDSRTDLDCGEVIVEAHSTISETGNSVFLSGPTPIDPAFHEDPADNIVVDDPVDININSEAKDESDNPDTISGAKCCRIPDELGNLIPICFKCYDDGHLLHNCPYRSVASRTPEVKAMIYARLLQMRQKYGKDNPIDQRRARSKQKNKKGQTQSTQKNELKSQGQGSPLQVDRELNIDMESVFPNPPNSPPEPLMTICSGKFKTKSRDPLADSDSDDINSNSDHDSEENDTGTSSNVSGDGYISTELVEGYSEVIEHETNDVIADGNTSLEGANNFNSAKRENAIQERSATETTEKEPTASTSHSNAEREQTKQSPRPGDRSNKAEAAVFSFCNICLGEDHVKRKDCPYSPASRRPIGFKALVQSRLENIRERFGMDNPIDSRRLKLQQKRANKK